MFSSVKSNIYRGQVRHDPHVDFSVECGSTNTRGLDHTTTADNKENTHIFEVPVEESILMLMFMFIEEARIFDLSAKMEEAFCRGWRRVAVVMSLSHVVCIV